MFRELLQQGLLQKYVNDMVVFSEVIWCVLDYFVCYLKASFCYVFVTIQNVFCVQQVAAVFCAVSSENNVPRHDRL